MTTCLKPKLNRVILRFASLAYLYFFNLFQVYPHVMGNLHDDGINHLHKPLKNISRVLGEHSFVASEGDAL